MRTKIPGLVGVAAMICCLIGVGCKKSKPVAKMDPHSPEAVNAAIQQQQVLLNEAMRTNNLQFIHGQMYYVNTLADALSRKLDGEKKERVDPILAELKKVAEEIDNSAGRHHKAATEANLQILYVKLKELDAEFRPPNDDAQKK